MQAHFETLLEELEEFIDQQAFAIVQENWDYLDAVIAKKDVHTQALVRLKPSVDTQRADIAERLVRIMAKEQASNAALEAKLLQARLVESQIKTVRTRIGKIRQLMEMNATTRVDSEKFESRA